MKIIKIASYIEPPPKMSREIFSYVKDFIRFPELKERLEVGERRNKRYDEMIEICDDKNKEYYQKAKDANNQEKEEINMKFSKFNISPESLNPKTQIDVLIDLDFSGWKYSSLLERCKKSNETYFNKVIESMSPVLLKVSFGQIGAKGFWSERENAIYIALGHEGGKYFHYDKESQTDLINSVKSTIDHELVHMSQSLFKKLNIHFGHPSKSIANPEISYSAIDGETKDDYFNRVDKVKEYMKENGMDVSSIHALTDIEFYTNLISDVESFKYRSKELNKKDRLLLFDIWTGRKKITINELMKYPFLNWVSSSLTPQDIEFGEEEYKFSSTSRLRDNNSEKWRKAVNEFYKAVRHLLA